MGFWEAIYNWWTGRDPAAEKARADSLLKPAKSSLYPEAAYSDFPNQLRSFLDHETVHIAFISLAQAGKSTIFNNCVFAAQGRKAGMPHQVGCHNSQHGQCTTMISRGNLTQTYINGWVSDADLLITDTVGFQGDEKEMIAIGNGLLKPSEIWPRDNSDDSIRKRQEILQRPGSESKRVTTFVLFISVFDLLNTSNPRNDEIINSIITNAKTQFTIGRSKMPGEVPVMICITKCDEYSTAPHYNNLLAQRKSVNLAGIFAKVQERFKLPKDNVFVLGFMDQSDETDWSHNSQDPRCIAIRHLLLQATLSGRMAARHFRDAAAADV